jgi:hypothetical protein
MKVAEVLLNAVSVEEEARMGGDGEEGVEDFPLFFDLLLEESEPVVFRADCCPQELDAVLANAVEAVDLRLGDVEGERRADGAQVVVDGAGIFGQDDDIVEIGEDERGDLMNLERWDRRREMVSRMEREKRKGARGSPCRTPDLERSGTDSPSAQKKMMGIGSL